MLQEHCLLKNSKSGGGHPPANNINFLNNNENERIH